MEPETAALEATWTSTLLEPKAADRVSNRGMLGDVDRVKESK
jgi:hypothetical protein